MSLFDAITVARKTLVDHYKLKFADGKMYGGAAADAYNVLAEAHLKLHLYNCIEDE